MRMRRFSSSHGGRLPVVSVRLAATVILARPPFEVYLTRRSAGSPFAPDAFVFPGGTVEAQDASEAARTRALGVEPERLDREFRATLPHALTCDEPAVEPDAGAALMIAAVRELFEEAGVLLARTASDHPIEASNADFERVASERVAVRNGALTFADFLKAHDWYADARALSLFSHWITPHSEPRRYNTHFFFAAAPPDQAALADAHETHDGLWIAPAAALERRRMGTMHLVYPTIKHLERLQAFESVGEALAFAQTKAVLTILPRETDDDFVIPPSLENAW
jgi:8-oxo-dGTP pyrophosphatase MutT (NUDIX family)